MRNRAYVVVCLVALTLGVLPWAGRSGWTWTEVAEHKVSRSGDLKWMPAPPALPKGAKVALLAGDPGKKGLYTIRLQAPAGYVVPPHWHSQDENLTVISGIANIGMGSKLDKTKSQALRPGDFVRLPAKMNHYAWFGTTTILQVLGMGPFDIHYINTRDDPRRGHDMKMKM